MLQTQVLPNGEFHTLGRATVMTAHSWSCKIGEDIAKVNRWLPDLKIGIGPDARAQRINRSSPTLFVTRSRSRHSSSGIAYLREMPVRSLNEAMFNFGVLLKG